MATTLAATCMGTLAAPQSDKQPITSNTGRFGDPTSVARKYQDYLYGVIKEMNPNELILTKTKFGVDQILQAQQENEIHPGRKAQFIRQAQSGRRDLHRCRQQTRKPAT